MNDPLRLLSQRFGEGRVTWRALQAAGLLTLGSIAGAPLGEISDRAHLSARSAGRLQEGARLLIAEGVAADLATTLPPPRGVRRARARRPVAPAPAGPSGDASAAAPARSFSEGVTAEELAMLSGERPAPPKPAPGT